MDDTRRARLAAWLGPEITITAMALMSGGAIQQNWRLDVIAAGAPHSWVLRTDSTATLRHSRPRDQEYALLQAAFAAGVAVPEPLRLCDDAAVIGAPFFLMRRVEGIAAGHRVVRDDTLAGGRVRLATELGRQLARIHAVKDRLDFLPPHPDQQAGLRFVAEMRAHLDEAGQHRPILEWGLRHLERHAPPKGDIVLCHNDFRTGNYMVTTQAITGILDWEFAAFGDPHEDLGWLCAKCWRFGSPHEAGGVGPRSALIAGYEAQSGRVVDGAQMRYWELAATLRWAVIALSQAQRHLSGAEPSLELALTGHIVPELELDILRMTS